jgi:hypothetical protein
MTMTTQRIRCAMILAAIGIVTVGLAACGGGSGEGATAVQQAQAADDTGAQIAGHEQQSEKMAAAHATGADEDISTMALVSPAGSPLQVKQSVKSKWQDGYCMSVTVTNTGSSSSNWSVTMPFADKLQSSWRATVTASGERLTASGLSYNNVLAAGASTDFGYCADGAGSTPNPDPNPNPNPNPNPSPNPSPNPTPAPSGIYSSTDPAWATIKRGLNITGENLSATVKGTKVTVNHGAVETTTIGRRSFDTGFKIHVPTSSVISYESRLKTTRWYQEDGDVQVFRLFQGDENVSSTRAGAARSEAFAANDSFKVANNRTNVWSGHFHVASRANEGFAIFQSKATSVSDPRIHGVSDAWSVLLTIDGNGRLVINERREADKVVYNFDMTGRGFDAEIRDDGENYEVYIDGVKQASGRFFRHPTLASTFRWGMYMGADTVTQGIATMYVSGARVTTKPGRLQ